MKFSRLSRREMMINAACSATGLTLGSSCKSIQSLLPGSGKPGFKIGACDWTLGKTADPGAFEVAKRIGLDGVQVSLEIVEDNLHLLKTDIQKTFLKAAKKQGMEIGSLAIGLLNEVPYKSDSRAEQWVSDSIDVCKSMGVKVVLVPFFGKGDLLNDENGIETVIELLKKVAPKAEEAGVALGLESWLSAEQHIDIISRVGSPAVKVYYDVANSDKMGYDIYEEIRLLGKHICEFHAKDYDDLYGKGTIAFKEVRRAMDDIGYRGWIQIEGVKMPLGREESLRYDAKYLKTIFPTRL